MATYSVNINERTNAGKALLNYLFSLGVVEKKPAAKKNSLDISLEQVSDGKVRHADSVKDMMKQILG